MLSTAQLLLSSGALVNSACTLETTYIAGLKGATALSYLVHCAPSTSGGAQQAVLSLIDLLLQRGADPNCRDIRVSSCAAAGLGGWGLEQRTYSAGQLRVTLRPPQLCLQALPATVPCLWPACLQENTPLHRLVSELHNCSQEEPPFTALLHRLLQSGATLEATNSTGFTPLGLLLRQGCHSNCMRPATLEAVRALLALGGSVVAAGGGRAWHAVLNAAFLAAWETESAWLCHGWQSAHMHACSTAKFPYWQRHAHFWHPTALLPPQAAAACAVCSVLARPPAAARKRLTRELVQLLIEKDDRGSDAGGGSGAGGGRGLNACDFLGMPPLAHLLELALSHMLENGFDAMEVRRVEWQVSFKRECGGSGSSRIGQHSSQLRGSGLPQRSSVTLLPLPPALPASLAALPEHAQPAGRAGVAAAGVGGRSKRPGCAAGSGRSPRNRRDHVGSSRQ